MSVVAMMKRMPASTNRLMAAGLPGARPDATRRCPDIDHSPNVALPLGKVHLPGETEALGEVPRSNHDDVNGAAVECPVDVRYRRPAFSLHYYERLLPGGPGSLHRILFAPVRGGSFWLPCRACPPARHLRPVCADRMAPTIVFCRGTRHTATVLVYNSGEMGLSGLSCIDGGMSTVEGEHREEIMSGRDDALGYLDENRGRLVALARDIWEHPEVGFAEEHSADLIARVLREAGFRVQKPVAGIPTAFVAEWGSGSPVIGILGEYDALPGLSQKVLAKKEPVEEGGPGHACGHHLLGVAGLGAALAVKATLESSAVLGTIRYYGCPAEETLIGKVFMARDGLFDDLDAALTWHPMYANTLWASSSTAVNSFKLNFHGRSAHAAGAPEAGRSALDAVMLTDVGVNYLREHMPSDVRIHCVVTHGGEAPNIVPAYAQSWYYVRAPKRWQLERMYERVLNVARGAALMTETTLEVDFVAACCDLLPNETIGRVMLRHMKELGPPPFDAEDRVFAEELKAALPPGVLEDTLRAYGRTREEIGDPLCAAVLDDVGTLSRGTVQPVSTDVGDVSHITPTAQVTTCCMPLGVPVHTWQTTAATGSEIGFKGMMLAARVLALSMLELLTSPGTLSAAREELDRDTDSRPYESPLPQGLQPQSSTPR
jgi:aminobenzoyl-glutamate utilization protein B